MLNAAVFAAGTAVMGCWVSRRMLSMLHTLFTIHQARMGVSVCGTGAAV